MSISKTSKRIDIGSLIHEGNPRTQPTMKLDKLMASYTTHGYQADSAIMVEETEPGQFLVLRGNRRSLAAIELGKTDKEAFDRIFPDGKMPAIVCKGITDQERILLRVDHSADMDREPLDDEGLFNAVCQLCRADLTQEEIAGHLSLWSIDKKTQEKKPNRSLVQRRVELAKLPQKVQDEFRILMRKGTSETPVRWSMVSGLYKKYKANHIEYPDGNMEFNELWDKCTTPKDEQKETQTTKGSLSAKKAEDFSMLSQSNGAKQLLLSVTGQGKSTFADLDVEILRGEQAIALLGRIKEHLGEADYQALLDCTVETVDAETVDAS